MGLFSPNVTFNRTVRVCDHEAGLYEVPLSFTTKYDGILDRSAFYKLPGFEDAAQVRRLTVDVENGGGEIQLRVFKTKVRNFKKILRKLRDAGWR